MISKKVPTFSTIWIRLKILLHVRVWWSASKKPNRRGRKGVDARTARKCREPSHMPQENDMAPEEEE
jgi:hypothetical protein